MESISQAQQVLEQTVAEEAHSTEAVFAHVSAKADALIGREAFHVDLSDDIVIGEHKHSARIKGGCIDDGMVSVDLSKEFPKDVAQSAQPSTVFPDQASTLSSSEQQDIPAIGTPYLGSIMSRQQERRKDSMFTDVFPDCDATVEARVAKMEAYISAIASEVMQERQARQALTAVCEERFKSIEEVVDRITTDLDSLAVGLDKLGPLISDPATINLEQKFAASSADQTQAFALLGNEVVEYKARMETLEYRCSNFASTKALGECIARLELLDGRYNEFITQQADSELEQQQAITSVTKDISAAYDVHKSQIIKVTENMTWLGQELQQRLERVEALVTDEMRARLEHLEIVVAAQKVGLEKLRSEHGTPVKQQFGHDEDWQKEKNQLTNQLNRLSKDVSTAMKRVNDSEGAILAAVVGHLSKLAESIPRADRNHKKVGVVNRVSRSRSLRISSQGSGTTISISNSPSQGSRQLESDASQSPGQANGVSLSLAAADAFINFAPVAPEASSISSPRPSKGSSQSRSSSLHMKRSTSPSPTRETSAPLARERRSASPLPRSVQRSTSPLPRSMEPQPELPTYESLIEDLVQQATKQKAASGEFPAASSSAKAADKEPMVSEAAAQVAQSVAICVNEQLANQKEDAPRELQASVTSSATSLATTLPSQPPQMQAQISVPQLPLLQQPLLSRAVSSVRLSAGGGDVGVHPPSGPMVVRTSSLVPKRSSEAYDLVAPQQPFFSTSQPEMLRRSQSPERVTQQQPVFPTSQPEMLRRSQSPERVGRLVSTAMSSTPTLTPFLTPRSAASGCMVQAPLVLTAQNSQTAWRHSAHSVG